MSDRPDASIIIPTLGRSRFLPDAVASVRQQVYPGNFEVIVVDNAPCQITQDDVAGWTEKEGPPVRYIPEARLGLHYARHAGARAAHGEVLIFLEDDVLAAPGWLAGLLKPLADARVACAGGKVLPRWEVPPPPWLADLPLRIHSLVDYGDQPREVSAEEIIPGGNLAIRRQVLLQARGFNPDGFADPKLIWHRGDGECGLLHRVRQAGYKIFYTPEAVVWHRLPAARLTPAAIRRRAFAYGIEAGYRYCRYQRPSRLGLGLWAVKSLARVVYHRGRQIGAGWAGPPTSKDKEAVMASYYLGRLLHALRLSWQPELRRYCQRSDYFD